MQFALPAPSFLPLFLSVPRVFYFYYYKLDDSKKWKLKRDGFTRVSESIPGPVDAIAEAVSGGMGLELISHQNRLHIVV